VGAGGLGRFSSFCTSAHCHGCRDGKHEILGRRLRIEIACQQFTKPVERQQGLGHRVHHRRAEGAASPVQPPADWNRRLDAAGTQQVGQLAVQLAQIHAQQAGSRRDQGFAHGGIGHVQGEAGLQRAHKTVGPQRIEAGLGSAPAEQGADQPIQRRQHVVHGERDFVMAACEFDALVELIVLEQSKVLETQQLRIDLLLAAALVKDAREFAAIRRADRFGIGGQRLDRQFGARTLQIGEAARARRCGGGRQPIEHIGHQRFGLVQHGVQAIVERRLEGGGVIGDTESKLQQVGHDLFVTRTKLSAAQLDRCQSFPLLQQAIGVKNATSFTRGRGQEGPECCSCKWQ
jgi:hypothetical protein